MEIVEPVQGAVKEAPVWEWVKEVEFERKAKPESNQAFIAIWHLLRDFQHHLEEQVRFHRNVRQLWTKLGVQEGSMLQIIFNPYDEEVYLHRLTRYREEVATDLLPGQKIHQYHLENNLGGHEFDGRLRAVLLIEDVRQYDIIDFAYSIRKTRPEEHQNGLIHLENYFASDLNHNRLLYAENRRLFVRYSNLSVEPEMGSYGDLVECVWKKSDPNPLLPDAEIPSWFNPYGTVEYGECSGWNEVARWFCLRFRMPETRPPEIRGLAAQICGRTENKEERVIMALRFVQEEMRYVSVSLEEHTCTPHALGDIFRRMFGDCKDKAHLLCALLREMEIDAVPALVDTVRKHAVADLLPTASAFNHVIVLVRLESGEFWMDATMGGQGGDLRRNACPNFGAALLVEPETEHLVAMPKQCSWAVEKTFETFKIRGLQFPVELALTKIYEGHQADAIRTMLGNLGEHEINHSFLKNCQKFYPGAKTAGSFVVKDLVESNQIRMDFNYVIDNLWSLDSSGSSFTGYFPCHGVAKYLSWPSVTKRKMPWDFTQPMVAEHKLVIHGTKPFQNNEKMREIFRCAAFEGKVSHETRSSLLESQLHLTILKDHLETAEIEGYRKALIALNPHLRQVIYYPRT